MGVVIGYTGTPELRFAAWRSMIDVRNNISKLSGRSEFSKTINIEKKVEKYMLKSYIGRAA